MVRRHEATAFMGGAYVFPGGRVDPADLDAAGGDEVLAFRLAAIRELFEDEFSFVARDDHPAARGKEVALRRIAPGEMMLLEEGHCLREHVIAACGPRPAATVDWSRIERLSITAAYYTATLPNTAVSSANSAPEAPIVGTFEPVTPLISSCAAAPASAPASRNSR